MDGWKTNLSFWVSVTFQGRADKLQGVGSKSTPWTNPHFFLVSSWGPWWFGAVFFGGWNATQLCKDYDDCFINPMNDPGTLTNQYHGMSCQGFQGCSLEVSKVLGTGPTRGWLWKILDKKDPEVIPGSSFLLCITFFAEISPEKTY